MGKATRMGIGRIPIGKDAAAVRMRVEAMEKILERGFTFPGTKQTFGLDVMLDLIPGIGPTLAAGMGLYMTWEARNLGMPKTALARMAGNVGVDWALGLIPWIGAVPDFFFRSNTRNLKIIRRHLDKHHPSTVTITPR